MSIGSIVLTENPVRSGPQFKSISLSKGQWEENSYMHTIRAMGGFWSMRFSIHESIQVLEELLYNGLGVQVKSYSPDGQTVLWEGFINSLTLTYPSSVQVTMSLDNVANKVWGRYIVSASGDETGPTVQTYDAEAAARLQLEAAAGGTFARSTTYQDTDSQSRWGVKEEVLSMGFVPSATVPNQIAQQYLNSHLTPKPEIAYELDNRGLQRPSLEINCHGWFRTLYWRRYNQTAIGGTRQIHLLVDDLEAANNEFLDSEWNTDDNISVVNRTFDMDRDTASILFDLARCSDSSFNRWVVGAYEDRDLRFQQADDPDNDNITYFSRIGDAYKRIWLTGGLAILKPMVRPNKWLHAEDVLINLGLSPTDLLEDPRAIFLEEVIYVEPDHLMIMPSVHTTTDAVLARLSFNGLGAV